MNLKKLLKAILDIFNKPMYLGSEITSGTISIAKYVSGNRNCNTGSATITVPSIAGYKAIGVGEYYISGTTNTGCAVRTMRLNAAGTSLSITLSNAKTTAASVVFHAKIIYAKTSLLK